MLRYKPPPAAVPVSLEGFASGFAATDPRRLMCRTQPALLDACANAVGISRSTFASSSRLTFRFKSFGVVSGVSKLCVRRRVMRGALFCVLWQTGELVSSSVVVLGAVVCGVRDFCFMLGRMEKRGSHLGRKEMWTCAFHHWTCSLTFRHSLWAFFVGASGTVHHRQKNVRYPAIDT